MRSERGVTLIELVVALSIMSGLLLGVGSVLFVANHAAGLWSQQVTQGQTLNQVAGTLDQDLHRYVPCSPQPNSLELDLCLPTQTSAQGSGINYTFDQSGNDLVRAEQWSGGGSLIVARDLVGQPEFAVNCTPGPNVDSGEVTISGLTYATAPALTKPLTVYFRAPVGSC